jgi:2-oxoglutarate dehydrogenase E1 component
MLLPHGYEGMGPEHSSARPERYLQLCAEKNIQVANLTTPAQYFHALRRQKQRGFRKPLVLMTPKSLLTRAEAVSPVEDFLDGTCFQEVLPDPSAKVDAAKVTRVVFCTGKVFYDLLKHRDENELFTTAIVRIEQLYPFHHEMVEALVSNFPAAAKFIWCQEEPLNMGAWSYIEPRLQKVVNTRVRYAGRDRASSPAAGSKAVHLREQKMLIETAFNA